MALFPASSSGCSAAAASSAMALRSASGSACHAVQRKRAMLCRTLAPSMVIGTCAICAICSSALLAVIATPDCWYWCGIHCNLSRAGAPAPHRSPRHTILQEHRWSEARSPASPPRPDATKAPEECPSLCLRRDKKTHLCQNRAKVGHPHPRVEHPERSTIRWRRSGCGRSSSGSTNAIPRPPAPCITRAPGSCWWRPSCRRSAPTCASTW